MTYKSQYLNKLRTSSSNEEFREEVNRVCQDLFEKVQKGEKITLAEEEYICAFIRVLPKEESSFSFDVSKFSGCKNYWFKSRYLLYSRDLNGYGKIYDFTGEVDTKQKQIDVDFLEKEFIDWYESIKGKRVGDEMFNILSSETFHQINLLNKFCASASIHGIRKDYLLKSLVLHSKHIYLLVKEYFEELEQSEIVISLFGHQILINAFCFIHTLFGHYASIVKQYQWDKSYHYDEGIDYYTLPAFFKEIVSEYERCLSVIDFDKRSINFTYNGKLYSIWFRPLEIHKPGKKIELYLRLQTFYPVESTRDIERLKKFRLKRVSDKLQFLV